MIIGTFFDNDRYYFYPKHIRVCYDVQKQIVGPKRNFRKTKYHLKTRQYIPDGQFKISRTFATLDPLMRKIYRPIRNGFCRYYNVRGSGRDWGFNELMTSYDHAVHERAYWRYQWRRDGLPRDLTVSAKYENK